jgi:hypothetical protein
MTSKNGWQRRFDDPIPLPRGRQLVTLKDVPDRCRRRRRQLPDDAVKIVARGADKEDSAAA